VAFLLAQVTQSSPWAPHWSMVLGMHRVYTGNHKGRQGARIALIEWCEFVRVRIPRHRIASGAVTARTTCSPTLTWVRAWDHRPSHVPRKGALPLGSATPQKEPLGPEQNPHPVPAEHWSQSCRIWQPSRDPQLPTP
jgi:hypothetical protein